MFSWDDCPQDEGELVWVEHTIRILIPRRGLGPLQEELSCAIHVESMSRSLHGKAIRCLNHGPECDQVAIDTEGYPWGEDHYGTKGKADKIYCPRCDGGEDQ